MKIVYGGTFDPIHLGHMGVAEQLVPLLDPDVFLYLPCSVPVHKALPMTGTHHRLTMVALGIQALPEAIRTRCAIDDREVQSGIGQYTYDSLQAIRADATESEPLIFVLGGDALHQLQTWHRWAELTSLAHLVVVGRPSFDLSDAPNIVQTTLQPYVTDDWSLLKGSPCGKVIMLPEFAVPISSTMLRNDLKNHKYWLSPSVYDYILAQHLYNVRP